LENSQFKFGRLFIELAIFCWIELKLMSLLLLLTFRVCSLHFASNSYERDVEHELLGLPPRSRLRRGAVPDQHVPVVVPSLINKLYSAPPPPRHVAAHRAKPKKPAASAAKQPLPPLQQRRQIAPAAETPPPDEAAQMVLLNALGLQPRNNNLWPTLEALGSVHFFFFSKKVCAKNADKCEFLSHLNLKVAKIVTRWRQK
jgi:hypothetical protein